MGFNKRDHVFAAPVERGPGIGVAAEIAQRPAHRYAVCIGLVEPRRIERPRHRLAADQRGAKTHAFFVTEADHLQRVRQALAA